MSRAIYHQGLTIECDLSGRRMKVDGRDMPIAAAGRMFTSELLPGTERDSPLALARDIIDRSAETQRRAEIRRHHLAMLARGVPHWNQWRREHPDIRPLLYEADLSHGAFPVDLSFADLSNANLIRAKLNGATLVRANFHEANLGGADLSPDVRPDGRPDSLGRRTDLTEANFCTTDLYTTNLSGAILHRANLQGTQLTLTNFEGAELVGCTNYGISAWDLRMAGAIQQDLVILSEREDASRVVVDDLQVAQFIYLLLHNDNIRQVIDTLTSKVVLILGRFTPGRKAVLDALREGLRQRGYVPVLFDFDGPGSRDKTETITLLARMASFVIADLTEPSSLPKELEAFVPELAVPVQPLFAGPAGEYAMFRDYWKYDWVLNVHRYDSTDDLMGALDAQVIAPAERKLRELRQRRLASYR